MNENIIVRKLIISDLDFCVSLRLEALQNSPTSFLSSYEEEKNSGHQFFNNSIIQSDDTNLIFGIFVDEKLVGAVGLFKEKTSKAKHKCNLWWMYVQPQYRGKGFAKLLIKTAIKHATNKMRCSVIKLSVEKNNTSAKKLYESFGFKVWGEEPKSMLIDGKFYDELHMAVFV